MDKNNPACLECPKHKYGMHYWKLNENKDKAHCLQCNIQLTEAQTKDMMYEKP